MLLFGDLSALGAECKWKYLLMGCENDNMSNDQDDHHKEGGRDDKAQLSCKADHTRILTDWNDSENPAIQKRPCVFQSSQGNVAGHL